MAAPEALALAAVVPDAPAREAAVSRPPPAAPAMTRGAAPNRPRDRRS